MRRRTHEELFRDMEKVKMFMLQEMNLGNETIGGTMSDYNYIFIVGAGGVGFWTTVGLTRESVFERVRVYDPDTVEGSGGRRLPIHPEATVTNNPPHKVAVLADFIEFTMGETVPFRTNFHAGPFTEQVYRVNYSIKPLIVDCSDMATELKQYHFKQAIEDRRYLRISYDGNGWVTVAKGLPIGPPTVQGYAVVPNMAESLAAGGIGASAVLTVFNHGLDALSEYQVRVQTGECLSTYGG